MVQNQGREAEFLHLHLNCMCCSVSWSMLFSYLRSWHWALHAQGQRMTYTFERRLYSISTLPSDAVHLSEGALRWDLSALCRLPVWGLWQIRASVEHSAIWCGRTERNLKCASVSLYYTDGDSVADGAHIFSWVNLFLVSETMPSTMCAWNLQLKSMKLGRQIKGKSAFFFCYPLHLKGKLKRVSSVMKILTLDNVLLPITEK